jgi:hypothetical protein
MTEEAKRLDPEGRNRVEPGSEEFERRLKAIKKMLHARDAAEVARKMAARKGKPAA